MTPFSLQLEPAVEVPVTFHEQGEAGYTIAGFETDPKCQGTLIVDDHRRRQGGDVVVIFDDGIEPLKLVIKSDDTVTWRNERDDTVTLKFGATGADKAAPAGASATALPPGRRRTAKPHSRQPRRTGRKPRKDQ